MERIVNGPLRQLLDPEVLCYVEKTLIPQYEQNDQAHGMQHVRYVAKRAMLFGSQVGVDIQLCFIAAAYHDCRHHVDRKRHEELSAQFFFEDDFMKRHLTVEEAIEDHRSSLKGEPRSILGKIISSADRTTDTLTAIARTDKYLAKHFPQDTLEQRIARSYNYIDEKYGPRGYARTYFQDQQFEDMKKELCEILKDKELYRTTYMKSIEM